MRATTTKNFACNLTYNLTTWEGLKLWEAEKVEGVAESVSRSKGRFGTMGPMF